MSRRRNHDAACKAGSSDKTTRWIGGLGRVSGQGLSPSRAARGTCAASFYETPCDQV